MTINSSDLIAKQNKESLETMDTAVSNELINAAPPASIRSYNLNFGPQHPSAHGVLRLVLNLNG